MNALLLVALYISQIAHNSPPITGIIRNDTLVGAAVIVDARGYALTCAHVLGRQDAVLVFFQDKTCLPAQVLHRDMPNDLALIRIAGSYRYWPASLCPSLPSLREPVTVFGHPKGYAFSLTTGTISAIGRTISLPDGDPLHNLIQIDAAVNPGNSGGAVFNAQGQLIGIPAAIHDGAQGIAFAIPVKALHPLLERIPCHSSALQP